MTTSSPERPLRVAALAKQVPATDAVLDPRGHLVRDPGRAQMNAFCRRAVTLAIALAEGRDGSGATVLTMGPPGAVDVLRESAAWGATQLWHLSDRALAGADALMTAAALAAALDRGGPFDLVLAGRSSLDGSTTSVPPMVAEMLGLPFVEAVTSLRRRDDRWLQVTSLTDTGSQSADVRLPCVLSVGERSCVTPTVPEEEWPAASRLDVRLWGRTQLQASRHFLPSATTTVAQVTTRPPAARSSMVLGPDRPAEQARRVVQLLVDRGALTAGAVDPTASTTADHPPSAHSTPSTHPQRSSHATQRSLVVVRSCRARDLGVLATVAALTREVGGTTTVLMPAAALAGDDVTSLLGRHGADAVVVGTGSEPRPFATAAGTLAAHGYTDVVGVSTPWGREVMARVAARLSMGLLSDLHELRGGPDGLRGAKMAPGGGELVEVRSSSAIRLLTVVDPAPFAGASPRPAAATTWLEVGHDDAVRNRVETVVDDWDALSRSPVVIGVGRGVREFELTLLEPLRRVLGAEYAATRKVTDEGWLPHSRQVGITGRSIAPALYLAVGISGSPDHLSSLRDAGTVVAVNEDPRARVFDHCDIGVVARWQDVVGPLTAALVAAGSDRGGAVPAPELLRRS